MGSSACSGEGVEIAGQARRSATPDAPHAQNRNSPRNCRGMGFVEEKERFGPEHQGIVEANVTFSHSWLKSAARQHTSIPIQKALFSGVRGSSPPRVPLPSCFPASKYICTPARTCPRCKCPGNHSIPFATASSDTPGLVPPPRVELDSTGGRSWHPHPGQQQQQQQQQQQKRGSGTKHATWRGKGIGGGPREHACRGCLATHPQYLKKSVCGTSDD